ncbi:TIGR01777 family oxidoreductase, partial [Enterobacter hormaechei]
MFNGFFWVFYNDGRGPLNMVAHYRVLIKVFPHAVGHAVNVAAIFRVGARAIGVLLGYSWVVVVGGQRARPKR